MAVTLTEGEVYALDAFKHMPNPPDWSDQLFIQETQSIDLSGHSEIF